MKIDLPKSDDNVIAFKPRAEVKASILIRRKPGTTSCLHHSYLIDPKDPVVECEGCKCTFTAMDALVDIAEDWTHRAWELKNMEDSLDDKRKELEALKREVANLRAQKRRLEAK